MRTRDEAHLYMDLHPCAERGSIDVTWDHAVVSADGQLGCEYYGTCPGVSGSRRSSPPSAVPTPNTPAERQQRPARLPVGVRHQVERTGFHGSSKLRGK